MKAVIHGKRYNTDTADLICRWHNGYGSSDFKHCSEELYKTPKGTWFIYGAGGAMSAYSEPCGDMTGGGSRIVPLTDDEARVWLEQHSDEREMMTALEQYFGDTLEDA